jgi:hypothetical protein
VIVKLEAVEETTVEPAWSIGPGVEVQPELRAAIVDYERATGVLDEPPVSYRGIGPRDLFTNLVRGSRRGEVVKARHRSFERIPVLRVAAPATEGSQVSTSWKASGTAKGGLSITLGPVTGGAAAKYTVSTSDTMTASAGTALAGHLVLPVWKEVTMVVPPGGYEAFPVADYWPDPDRSHGFEELSLDAATLTTDPDATPLKSAGRLEGERSREVEYTTSFGLEVGGDESSFTMGATAELIWSVTVAASWKLAAGDYRLSWLNDPPGCVLASIQAP